MAKDSIEYNEASIRSLDWREHIRLRPGMYIGKLGDGSAKDDGIYVLVKEVIDNCIDEHMMGYGKVIEVKITDQKVTVRDYGRGIPLGKVVDVVSKINTGAKYDSGAFQKSVGLNGVGTKAVNALSNYFKVQAFRDGATKMAEFKKGVLTSDPKQSKSTDKNGTLVEFEPDDTMFKHYHFIPEYLDDLMWNYAFLNAGLIINYNGRKFYSKDGLLDLLKQKSDPEEIRYPIIHFTGDDIEVTLTHGNQYGEEYYSFVNGQNTTQGGTHLAAFR
ncbi:MAG TPA: ATP-binding protein, partial [Cyclobacteriaceae bacterium]|nr:ATP-binding protein [Cyclobacteriaceae bacterium]